MRALILIVLLTGVAHADCPSILACYAQCGGTQQCVAQCDARADAPSVQLAHALAVCAIQNHCSSTQCPACTSQLAACAGVSPPAAPASTTGSAGAIYIGYTTLATAQSKGVGFSYVVLFDDGTALSRVPRMGLDGVDRNALTRAGIAFSTYRVEGTTVMINDYGNHIERFERRPDGSLVGREGPFHRVDSLDGVALDGAFGPATGRDGFRFTADGRFQTTGTIVSFFMPDGSMRLPAGAGTYRIAHNTLLLTYSTGQVVRLWIVAVAGRAGFPHPASFLLDGTEYVHK